LLREVTSPDGVRIACEVGGEGTPLVMVHGAGSGGWSFDLVRPHLEDVFTVWSIDRRGRGDSSDSDSYAIEREFDDVVAVVREAGDGALLFGHSYGGLVAAGAAERLDGLPRLALYEAPMGGVLADEAWTARFEANLEVGQADQAVRDFMSDVGGYTDAEIEAMQGTPAWRARIAAAPTVPRELHAEHRFATDDLRLTESATPTLILVGSESPSWAKRSTEAFAAAIPQSELHVLEGHGHGAAVSGPELLASELREFFEPGV
jgi:pimeloyl-ACP methyl ester carboxylesterase